MLWKKIISLDERITSALRFKENHPLRPLAIFFAHSGDSWFILAVLFIVWLIKWGDIWHYKMAVMAFSTIALAVLVIAIKFSFKRRRPEGEWGAIYRKSDPHSFPSGHAARTTMLGVLALIVGPPWFGLMLIIWAPFVCLARVAMGVHYFSDILAGILLGVAAAFGFSALSPLVASWLPFLF